MLTVRPALPYGPAEEEADAAAMRKAMKGLGTDEKAIINILANCSNLQRQVIARKFSTLYGRFPKTIATIKSVEPYNRLQQWADAKAIHAALRTGIAGIGCDWKPVIDILANRTNKQRQQIAQIFDQVHAKELVKELKSELGGSLEDTIVACLTPVDEFYAKELSYAMSGFGFVVSDNILIEILCTLSSDMITQVMAVYSKNNKKDLECDIEKSTSGVFQLILLSILNNQRESDNVEIDSKQVEFDTWLLTEAAEDCERDFAIFVEILTMRSWPHLVAVLENFDKFSLAPFERVVRKGFSGSARDSLLTIYQFATDSDGYFADVLYNSMAGLGTRDRTLIRVVVTRAEIDMGNIKVAFINKYLKTLETTIDGDCFGDYKKMLLALITPFAATSANEIQNTW